MTRLCSGLGPGGPRDAVPEIHSLGIMSESSTFGQRKSEALSAVMFLVMTYQSHMLGPKGEVQRNSDVNTVIVDQNSD